MTKLEQIEEQVAGLGLDEIRAFASWFEAFEAQLWDEQIEADAKNGKLRSIAEQSLKDHALGRSTRL